MSEENGVFRRSGGNMKKLVGMLLMAALAFGTVAVCEEKNIPDAPGTLSGTVGLDGSTSMERVVSVLTESFREVHPGVIIHYNASGSGAGIAAALNGTVDMGLSSRDLSGEEQTGGAVANLIALDGVAVVVHPSNRVEDLTADQIADLFAGKITDWAALGGAEGVVAVLGREPGAGTRDAFEKSLGVEDMCAYHAEYTSAGDVVGQVSENPNAIGYTSLSAVHETVKTVKVGGVACTGETVRDGTYPIQRPFLIVTKEGGGLSPAARAFLEYAQSGEAADLIALAGAVAPGRQEEPAQYHEAFSPARIWERLLDIMGAFL